MQILNVNEHFNLYYFKERKMSTPVQETQTETPIVTPVEQEVVAQDNTAEAARYNSIMSKAAKIVSPVAAAFSTATNAVLSVVTLRPARVAMMQKDIAGIDAVEAGQVTGTTWGKFSTETTETHGARLANRKAALEARVAHVNSKNFFA
tara:strand:- start:4344 stop:4790 length:447 start_codon:yes stop_codon:yes gene_type:complete